MDIKVLTIYITNGQTRPINSDKTFIQHIFHKV